MTTVDAWFFVGEVFAGLLLFWLFLMWVLNRLDTRLNGCTCRGGHWDPMCVRHPYCWVEDDDG